ncbi:MAG: LamG-like jellyroll fold domain-containing protein [Bacteroidales bacterium]
MRRILLTFSTIVLAVTLSAQAPQAFKYQTVVRNSDGSAVIASQTVAFRISILQGSITGTESYVETHSVPTNEFGLAAFNIGEGTPVTATFSSVDWAAGPFFVKVEIDPANGTDFEEVGTSQLLSVPFAMYARTSELAEDLNSKVDLVNDKLGLSKAGLVLWNKMGSVEEVENSETGPDGTIVGTVNFDNDVRFGKGLTPNTGNAASGVDFPTTVVDPERGSIEMWTKFYTPPAAGTNGVYGFVNVNHWSHNVMSFTWHNSGSILDMTLTFNSTGRNVSLGSFSPPLNTPVHIACVWDREGINGSGDYMRIYVDGEMVASNSTDNDWGTDNSSGTFRVAAPWDASFATDRYSVDNLKIWGFAKTDFSDRDKDMEEIAIQQVLNSPVKDMSASGITSYGNVNSNTAGYGAALYMASDGNYEEADAGSAATMPCVALALETGTGRKSILLQGYIRNDSWTLTPGGLVYVSPVTGVLTQTAPSATGQQVQIVGYATQANTIFFNPNLMLIEIK